MKNFETLLNQKKESKLNICSSFLCEKDDEVCKNEKMYVLVEYKEDMYPKTGLFSYVFTGKELNDNFEVFGKANFNCIKGKHNDVHNKIIKAEDLIFTDHDLQILAGALSCFAEKDLTNNFVKQVEDLRIKIKDVLKRKVIG